MTNHGFQFYIYTNVFSHSDAITWDICFHNRFEKKLTPGFNTRYIGVQVGPIINCQLQFLFKTSKLLLPNRTKIFTKMNSR